MRNKEIIEYKESFISKIKKYFKNLFKSKKEENDYVEEISNFNNTEIATAQKESEFFNDIKVETSDIDKYMDKKNFLEYIDANVEALKMLSVDRLRKLKEYYDGVIEKNDKIIENLKKSSYFKNATLLEIYHFYKLEYLHFLHFLECHLWGYFLVC